MLSPNLIDGVSLASGMLQYFGFFELAAGMIFCGKTLYASVGGVMVCLRADCVEVNEKQSRI